VSEALRHRPPSDVVPRLNQFYQQATRAVISRDGTLDKLLGNKVVAFFGTPYNEERHEHRAVDAGLDIVRAFTGFWEHEALVGGAVGTGLAFVGNVGQGETRDYTAVGQVVTQVAAAADQARPGELLVLPSTYAALGAAHPESTVRTVEVKGEREPLGVHVIGVAAPGEARTRQRRFLATILSLDLVGSTDIAARLGDAAWRDLLARHYAEIRALLLRHGGDEIDTAGDGLLATFGAPVQAIRFAHEAQRADRGLGLAARAGIHTGEVEQDGTAIRGIAVVVASRIGALGGADEVLVSGTVRDLAAGSEIVFTDRGMHQLKGVPEPRAVYAAEEANASASSAPSPTTASRSRSAPERG
jgi:class 3 adenylate cyclase